MTFWHTDLGLVEGERQNQKEIKRQKQNKTKQNPERTGMQLEPFKNSACQYCLLLSLCKDSCNTAVSFLPSLRIQCQQNSLLCLYFYSHCSNPCVSKSHVSAGFLRPSVLPSTNNWDLKHLSVLLKQSVTSRIAIIREKNKTTTLRNYLILITLSISSKRQVTSN